MNLVFKKGGFSKIPPLSTTFHLILTTYRAILYQSHTNINSFFHKIKKYRATKMNFELFFPYISKFHFRYSEYYCYFINLLCCLLNFLINQCSLCHNNQNRHNNNHNRERLRHRPACYRHY